MKYPEKFESIVCRRYEWLRSERNSNAAHGAAARNIQINLECHQSLVLLVHLNNVPSYHCLGKFARQQRLGSSCSPELQFASLWGWLCSSHTQIKRKTPHSQNKQPPKREHHPTSHRNIPIQNPNAI